MYSWPVELNKYNIPVLPDIINDYKTQLLPVTTITHRQGNNSRYKWSIMSGRTMPATERKLFFVKFISNINIVEVFWETWLRVTIFNSTYFQILSPRTNKVFPSHNKHTKTHRSELHGDFPISNCLKVSIKLLFCQVYLFLITSAQKSACPTAAFCYTV